jgi:hypothetical protein
LFDAQAGSPPADLEDACIQLVAFKHTMHGSDGLAERRVNQTTDTFAGLSIPLTVAVILDKYRRVKLETV